MKQLRPFVLLCFAAFAYSVSGQIDPNWDNNQPCSPGSQFCCTDPSACNGPGGPDGSTYDPDNPSTGGCYYNCIPIDSGLLLLLLGGGLFGAFLINRQRQPRWEMEDVRA
jgi:hypothetical protein